MSLPLLTPLFGFSTITAPEITAEFQEISEANWIFKKKILKRADVSNMTLTRGVVFYDSDFYRWMMASITGDMTGIKWGSLLAIPVGGYTPRRMLMLVQFFARAPVNLNSTLGSAATTVVELGLFATGAAMTGGNALSGAIIAGLEVGLTAGLSALGAGGAVEFAARLPARAWLLHNCVPTRYKVSQDFDALSSQLSIAELELTVEMLEEFSLAAV